MCYPRKRPPTFTRSLPSTPTQLPAPPRQAAARFARPAALPWRSILHTASPRREVNLMDPQKVGRHRIDTPARGWAGSTRVQAEKCCQQQQRQHSGRVGLRDICGGDDPLCVPGGCCPADQPASMRVPMCVTGMRAWQQQQLLWHRQRQQPVAGATPARSHVCCAWHASVTALHVLLG